MLMIFFEKTPKEEEEKRERFIGTKGPRMLIVCFIIVLVHIVIH
jgi:uncharacterized DUF497 family protein